MSSKEEKQVQEWDTFFTRCMRDHVDFNAFPKEVDKLYNRTPLPDQSIFEAWARQRNGGTHVRDRLLCYFELMVQSGILTDTGVLRCISLSLKATIVSQEKAAPRTRPPKQTIEATVIERLTFQMIQRVDTNTTTATRIATLRVAKPLIVLLSRFTAILEGVATLTGPALDIGNALGQYVGAYINELSRFGLLTCSSGGPPKDLKTWFTRYLPPFIALVLPSNGHLGQALDTLQKQSGLHNNSFNPFLDDGIVDGVNLTALTYQENVLDSSLIVTRAASYVYLNAMLTGRPLCDDVTLFHYFNSRYNGQVSTLVTDLITASFDVLSNAINRTDPKASILIYRSFLTNKLPVLLESYSTILFPPFTIEACITEALSRMDPPSDPYSTQTFDLLDSNDMLSEARAEFLFACALYGLLPEQSIESILGDVPMQSLPEAGKYNKADLVAQCATNSAKIEELVGEMENMDGNAAEIAGALIEMIQSQCAAKDSITLKTICNALSRKTQALDVLMLFTQPNNILQPLCDLLDHWQIHDDQGEHNPVYDEFGSIFLFILVIRQHFDLQNSDFGIAYTDSFVLKYIRSGGNARDPSELTEHENQLLGGWIKGLFEMEGISDELMSTCSPRDFHMLVATLFDQSLKACEAGILSLETLRGGFEYLLEPFLLPSLITGITWFTHRLLTPNPIPAASLVILLPTLSLLVHPLSLSSDSLALHEAVIAVTALPLERALASVQKAHPRRQDIDPLLSTLKPRIVSPRCSLATAAELDTWCGTPAGSLLAAIQHSVSSLVNWSNSGVLNAAPPNYTHRLLLTGVAMLGANVVLEALLDVLMKYAGSSSPGVVLDIVTAMICAPASADGRERLSLRHVLNTAYSDAYTLSKKDSGRAEMVVRLQRRVDSQGGRSEEREIGETMDGGGTLEVAVDADGNGILLEIGDGTAVDVGTDGGMADVLDVGMGMDLDIGDVMGDGLGDDDFLGM